MLEIDMTKAASGWQRWLPTLFMCAVTIAFIVALIALVWAVVPDAIRGISYNMSFGCCNNPGMCELGGDWQEYCHQLSHYGRESK